MLKITVRLALCEPRLNMPITESTDGAADADGGRLLFHRGGRGGGARPGGDRIRGAERRSPRRKVTRPEEARCREP